MLAWSVIIVMYKSNGKKYETTRANMSRVTNEGVMICFKAIMANFLTVVGIIVEHSTLIKKPKGCIEESCYIRQPTSKVTSSDPIISPYLVRSFFFISMMRSNSISKQSIGNR